MNKHGTIRDGDIPELVWPEDPDTYLRCADAYTRTMAFETLDLPPRPRARRRPWVRVASWFAMGAVAGASAAVIGLSLAHAYEQTHSQLVVPTSAAVPPGMPVIYPSDLPGLLNAPTDQACAPGPQATIAPCDRP